MTRIIGFVRTRAFRRGRLLWVSERENLKVNTALAPVAHLLGGDVTNFSITAVGFGSGTSVVAVTDTALSAAPAFYKAVTSHSYPVAGQVSFHWDLSYTSDVLARGINIQELGLFCNTGPQSLPYLDGGGSPPNMTLFSHILLGLGTLSVGMAFSQDWIEVVS